MRVATPLLLALVFIGIADVVVHVPVTASLGVIAGVLTLAVAASLVRSARSAAVHATPMAAPSVPAVPLED